MVDSRDAFITFVNIIMYPSILSLNCSCHSFALAYFSSKLIRHYNLILTRVHNEAHI